MNQCDQRGERDRGRAEELIKADGGGWRTTMESFDSILFLLSTLHFPLSTLNLVTLKYHPYIYDFVYTLVISIFCSGCSLKIKNLVSTLLLDRIRPCHVDFFVCVGGTEWFTARAVHYKLKCFIIFFTYVCKV
jgi:hypothetical protein